jgi:hypothetical protein
MIPGRIYVVKKENGFTVVGEFGDANTPDKVVRGDLVLYKEIVVEGSDPKKLGAAVLAMFKAPRKPRVKKET